MGPGRPPTFLPESLFWRENEAPVLTTVTWRHAIHSTFEVTHVTCGSSEAAGMALTSKLEVTGALAK